MREELNKELDAFLTGMTKLADLGFSKMVQGIETLTNEIEAATAAKTEKTIQISEDVAALIKDYVRNHKTCGCTPEIQFEVKHSATPSTDSVEKLEKTLGTSPSNPTRKNVEDLVMWGDENTWKLIHKASSQEQGWMKSTKALEIPGIGIVLQVTTQQRNPDGSYAVAEALQFVPGAETLTSVGNDNKVTGRLIRKSTLPPKN